MAVILEGIIKRYVGLSTDSKPTLSTLDAGSEFYETDSGNTYKWSGSAWSIIPSTASTITGGAGTIQDLIEEFAAFFDVARSPQSGTYTFADADEETLYEKSSVHPFPFYGGYIDWTGANAGAGEDTTVKVYIKLKSGGTYREIYEEIFLDAAVPDPVATPVPRSSTTDTEPKPILNVYGVKVTASQAAVGGGWNSIDHQWFDGLRGN